MEEHDDTLNPEGEPRTSESVDAVPDTEPAVDEETPEGRPPDRLPEDSQPVDEEIPEGDGGIAPADLEKFADEDVDEEEIETEIPETEQAAGEEPPGEQPSDKLPNPAELPDEELRSIIEALILVSDKPLSISKIQSVLEGIAANKIKDLVAETGERLAANGLPYQVREIGGGYVLSTDPKYAGWVRKLLAPKVKISKLSQPALETLAVIAYKQPVTRAEVEAIRGVNVDSTVRTLLDKRLVEIVGYKDVIGKPATYGTTNEFLLHFGLSSLSDLPSIEELRLNADS